MTFPKCECGNIITEDDCGSCTDEEGYTYCCNYNPYTGEYKQSEVNNDN